MEYKNMTIDSAYDIVNDDFAIQIRIPGASCAGAGNKFVVDAMKRMIAGIFDAKIVQNRESDMIIFGRFDNCPRCAEIKRLLDEKKGK